jgi:hypothetical protein
MRKLKVEKTTLDGVLVVHPLTQHEDFRGDYVETYNEEMYRAAGITEKFVQDDYATSTKHVLRGIHGDAKTVKLISCLYGRIYVVVRFYPVGRQPAADLYSRKVRKCLPGDVGRFRLSLQADDLLRSARPIHNPLERSGLQILVADRQSDRLSKRRPHLIAGRHHTYFLYSIVHTVSCELVTQDFEEYFPCGRAYWLNNVE